MKRTTILAFSVGVLLACGSGGGSAGGERGTAAGARDPGQAEARSGSSEGPAAETVPFGPRSEARRRQDAVLRSSSGQRQKVVSDST